VPKRATYFGLRWAILKLTTNLKARVEKDSEQLMVWSHTVK